MILIRTRIHLKKTKLRLKIPKPVPAKNTLIMTKIVWYYEFFVVYFDTTQAVAPCDIIRRRQYMPYSSNWMPGSRASILEMAINWSAILDDKGDPWSIPAGEVTALDNLIIAAQSALAATKGDGRGPVATAKCKAAFAALKTKMRYLKDRYFKTPPLTDADLISLGLKPKDTSHTPVPAPTGILEGDAGNPAPGQVLVTFHKFAGTLPDVPSSEWYKVLRWGFFDLAVVPASPQELGEVWSTRRQKKLIPCPPGTKGKVIWCCGRYENGKGDAGSWGPMFNTVVT
jgi:hypothetical protein